MNQVSPHLYYILSVLFNCDVKKRSHFSKIINLHKRVISLILLFHSHTGSGFFVCMHFK